MANLTRDFFIYLSQNQFLNEAAKKYGLKLGASKVVAGTDLPSVTKAIKALNAKGMSCTVDHLGEFVYDRQEAEKAKQEILKTLEIIDEEQLDCHVSVKLTQIGLDIDYDFCFENIKDIVDTAKQKDIFVNIDMEDYAHYNQTLDIVLELAKQYDNVGTVMQAYLYRAEPDLRLLKDIRMRLVKGAYKEDPSVAIQHKADIDQNYLKLIKMRLESGVFTSIATHDHHIINEVKAFVRDHHISKDNFEFQMLYGFRTELQEQLVAEGYRFCTYVPFGEDWYGYFMRRLAERPQNLNFVIKDVTTNPDGTLKKGPVVAAGAIASLLAYRALKKRKK